MIGNPLATNTKKDKTYNQEYFLYNQYFWNYNARAQGSDTDMHTFKANVPYKLHPWVDNLDIISNWLQSGQTVRFDFSSDVEAVPPCQVITVDASQCTNLKAIYSKGGSPKFIENEEKTGYRSLQFSLEADITLYRQGDLSLADTKNWKTALKIILKSGSGSGLHSAKNKFPLQGNTAKPTFWNLVRSPGGVVDAWIGNSDKFPQTQGDFTVWIPCAPRKSACCVPSEDGNFSTCQNTTPQQCTALGGNFSDGKNCLKYDHIGTPGADGKMTGRCPGTCPRKPQAFTFRLDQTSTSCDCGVTPEGTPEACPQIQAENQRIADFSNSGVGQHCPGTFSSSMFGKATIPGDSCVPDDTFMGASNNYPHISPNAILHFPVKDATPISPGPYTCPDNPFYSREGEIDCNGGFLTQTTTCTNDDETSSTCSRTTTITISKPLCPADSYAAEDKNGKITCCKVNEEWDREEGVCKPIYTGQYCS
ncbi:MAG: hypothetical protein NT033_05470 [Candidatus Omnitrophica bacterium]|nr:hypothetical protein [Candidatus Omnitrophota bacterium]